MTHELYVAFQAPLSTRFPKQEYCSGLPFPSPGNLPDPGIKHASLHWKADSLVLRHQGSPGNADFSKNFSRYFFNHNILLNVHNELYLFQSLYHYFDLRKIRIIVKQISESEFDCM